MDDLPNHATSIVEFDGRRADVDVDLAPIVGLCWWHHVSTENSCQEETPGRAYIQFTTADDAERFLNLVCPHERDIGGKGLWNRMVGLWTTDAELTQDDLWELDAFAHDRGERWDDSYAGAPSITVSVVIRFPSRDIPEVTERLARLDGSPHGIRGVIGE